MSTTHWPCGTLKSTHTAFSGTCLEDRPTPVLRATPGRKPKGIATGANATSSLAPRRSTLEVFPSQCVTTTRIMRASI